MVICKTSYSKKIDFGNTGKSICSITHILQNVGLFFLQVGMFHPTGRNVPNAPCITFQF